MNGVWIFVGVWSVVALLIALLFGRMVRRPSHSRGGDSHPVVAGGTCPVAAAGCNPLHSDDRLRGASRLKAPSLTVIRPGSEVARPGPSGDESAGPGRASSFPADIAGEGSPE